MLVPEVAQFIVDIQVPNGTGENKEFNTVYEMLQWLVDISYIDWYELGSEGFL